MGEAKQKKQRLGDWYGKPVGPGHPDYRESPKENPELTCNMATMTTTSGDMPVMTVPKSRPHRPINGLALIALLGTVMASGIDLGPPPKHRR